MMFKCYYSEWENTVFTEIIHHFLEHHPKEQIRFKQKKKKKKKKLKSISYKVIQKTLSYFLKVSEILTCVDTEIFLGGAQVQSFVVYLVFQKGNGISTSVPVKPIPSNQNGPPSARQRNVI